MWRSAKSSFTRYSLEMAEILCKCLKDPHREKALARYKLNVKQTDYTNGVAQPSHLHGNFTGAFEPKSSAQ
ncbi:mitochondrial ATP synthase F1, epsilon subunit, putative [Babesia caballi]|uniref:Mitochondrial ATP synthase F1, epsilon subunit, putative n=1 Tax=Babesia caballi TaxID=5871 RepID=A0AAV4LZ63_BABCB|nr:mitochondrial ATP synthase F1, epsilon subunit, putative [Babesia caballi]